jgi:hypothetical protein
VHVHGHGTRRLGLTAVSASACDAPDCLGGDAIARAIMARMKQGGIEVYGYGAGECADADGDDYEWEDLGRVHAWKQADAVIGIIDDELRAQDVGDSFGVSVRGPECGTPEWGLHSRVSRRAEGGRRASRERDGSE